MAGIKKKRSNFFDRMIQNNGPDFLASVNSETLRRSAKSLFRDIAFGSIDKNKCGQYFLDKRFMDVMINEAMASHRYYMLHVQSLNNLAAMDPRYNDEFFQMTLNRDSSSATAYMHIYQGLLNLAATQNLSYLDMIAANVRSYRLSI